MALTIHTPYGHIPNTISTTTTADPITGSFSCDTNTKAVVVMLYYAAATQRTGGTPTYGGQNMTQVESLAGVTEAVCEMWYLINPPTGEQTLSIQNDNTRTAWVNIAGVNAGEGYTVAVDDTGIAETTAANPTVQLITTVNNFFAFACVATGDNTFNPTAQRGEEIYNDDPAAYGSASQYLSGSASGTVNMFWTEATSDDYGALAIAFKEVAGNVVLSVNNVVHILTSTEITLDVHNPIEPVTLTVADSIEAMVSGNIVLSQKYTLGIQDAAQSQITESVVLIQDYLLSPNNTQHLQTATSVVLTAYIPNWTLTVQDSVNAQTADNIQLAQHYSALSLSDAINLQVASNVILTAYLPSFSLTVDSSTNLHTSSSPNLTENYVLEVQNAVQFHNAFPPFASVPIMDNFNRSDRGFPDGIWTQKEDFPYIYDNHFAVETGNNAGLIAEDGTHFPKRGVEFYTDIYLQNINDFTQIIFGDYFTNISPVYFYVSKQSGYYQIFLDETYDFSTLEPINKQVTGYVPDKMGFRIDSSNVVYIYLHHDDIWEFEGAAQLIGERQDSPYLAIDLSGTAVVSYVDNFGGGVFANALNLSQGFAIAVQDSIQTQVSENIALAQNQVLVVNSTQQLQTASNVDLVQSGAIGVQTSTQLQISSIISLTQHQLLEASNSIQIQTSGNVNLAQGGAIEVQNSIQMQTADNTILTQNFVLVVLIAIQLITSNNVSLGGGGAIPIKMMHYIRLRSK